MINKKQANRLLMLETTKNDLEAAEAALKQEDWATAEQILHNYLNDYPDDARATWMLSRLYTATHRQAAARVLLKALLYKDESNANYLAALQRADDLLLLHDEAEDNGRRLLQVKPNDAKAWALLSTTYIQKWETDKAIWAAEKSLAIDPTNRQSLVNLGYAYLQRRDFDRGWRYYAYGLGFLLWRQKHQYAGEPLWDGEKGKHINLVVYSEQGIGDQIVGFEPLREAIRDVNVVAVDCDGKMQPVFARSFPEIPVYTNYAAVNPKPRIDASINIFGLHTIYRRRESDYPRTPFLKPDPERAAMCRALLDRLGPGPKVGLSWSGGISITGRMARRAPLDAWLPILRTPGVQWVSLEYRDRSEEVADFERRKGIQIHTWPYLTQTPNHEDVTALISQLDAIVGVPTAAIHTAGGLGLTGFVMVHPSPNIHYPPGDHMPYYRDMRMFRRESGTEWHRTVPMVADALADHLGIRRAA